MTLKIFYLVSGIHNTGIHVQLFGSEPARDQALKLVMEEWLDVREKDWPSRPDVIGLRERLSAGDINAAWLWFEEECRNPDDMYQVHEEMVEVDTAPSANYYVMHHHKYGVSIYLAKCDHVPSEEEVVEACGIEFEPEKQEYIDIEHIGPGDKVHLIPAKSPPEPC